MSPLIIISIIVAIIAIIFSILFSLQSCTINEIKNDSSPIKYFFYCLISPLIWT